METISRRAFVTAALIAPAVLANADVALAAKKKAKKKKGKTAEVGQAVSISKKGKLSVTVVGCETSESLTAEYMETGESIADENCVIALMLVVDNKSVKTPYEGTGFEYESHGVDFVDADGVSLSPFSSGSDYKGYACALGGYLNAQKGQADREVLFFQVPRGTSEIAAILGKTKVVIPVQQV